MGLSAALATAGNSLEVFSTGLQVAGQNIANASSPNYIREQLNIVPSFPDQQGNLVLGTGAVATGVRQQINTQLESQVHTATSDAASASALSTTYQQLETTLQALGTNNLSTQLGGFVTALNNLANTPQSQANAQLVVGQGQQLASQITTLRTNIDQQRTTDNDQVTTLVSKANTLINQIAQLNPQIVSMTEAGLGGSDAGSLSDQQYADLTQLSQIIPITATQQSDGSYNVSLGGNYLVQGTQVQNLQTTTSVDRDVQVVNVSLENNNTPINGTGGGQLNGVIASRDQVLGGFVDQLDAYTSSLISSFNQIYSSGQGVTPLTSVTGTNAVSDPNASLASAGLAFPPQQGSFRINVTNTQTGTTQTTTIPVNIGGSGPDTTLSSLQAALGGVSNVTASTANGQLSISAASGYTFSFSNDTSGALAGLGINTFFTGSNSEDIGVNSDVVNNPSLFATGQGGGPADGSNAILLAQFADQPQSALGNMSLNSYDTSVTAQLAQNSSAAQAMAQGTQGYLDTLNTQRSQISGVSLDAEAISVLNYQQGYQAAAKVISTIDELFHVLVQM